MSTAQATFSTGCYTTELMLLADALAAAFPNTVRVLYMNWLPGGLPSELGAVAAHAATRQVGIGGPDIFPDTAVTAYSFYPQLQGSVPLMQDVQWPNYDHTDPPGDTDALLQFGIDALRLNYVCWQPRWPYEPNMLATIANAVFDDQFPSPPAPEFPGTGIPTVPAGARVPFGLLLAAVLYITLRRSRGPAHGA